MGGPTMAAPSVLKVTTRIFCGRKFLCLNDQSAPDKDVAAIEKRICNQIISDRCSFACGKGRVERVHGTHQDRLVKKLRLATVSNYDDANAYLQEHYIAQHNRHYARPAAAEADYHRQRPTARQLDDVFWLEEERVLSEDWVVRYKNRLLQLARQNRHWAPAQSRVRVRENEPGHIVIHYRGQSLP